MSILTAPIRILAVALLQDVAANRTEDTMTRHHAKHAELRGEGIDCANVVHVAGLTTPVSAILLDDAGERTITTYRDRQLKEVACPDPERAIEGCAIVSADNRFPTFVGGICAAARRRTK